MKMLHIVMGTTGEYSDRSEWPVVAYHDETLAMEHVRLATRRAKEIFAVYDRQNYGVELPKNEYDADMQMQYTGTDYFIYVVPVARSLPKIAAAD